ncbi:hypothetical protein K3725_12525 [Leisingera sp. S132]|uniref:hypothetical protein n=1 Tax=Leisingera sp. S132 TaxID=2867016 RepID=UPI0021A28E3D|nr:hypothetical protein [Leisingera sp. S132]UWQ78140.1 hypothetical protein K3725_12525 [Leisingera sp. S132]
MATLLSACGASEPQVYETSRLSTDPVLSSVLYSFEQGCIRNAPEFSVASMRTSFAAYQPQLAPGMHFFASGEEGRKCEAAVLNYGTRRPKPSVGDINRLAEALARHTGGMLKPDIPGAGAGGAKVKVGRTTYNVSGYVSNKGRLTLMVYD